MTTLLSFIVSVVSAIALPASPNQPNYIYIAEAKTNSLASSVLRVENVPETTEAEPALKIAPDENKGENTERDDFDTSEGLRGITGRENGLPAPKQDPTKQEIVEMIKKVFPDEPLMLKIAECESVGLRHYVKGEVLRGEAVKEDRGLFQINETYWLKKSLELEIDIYDLDGNIKMARHIYDTQGLSAWSASFKNCWKNL